MAERQLGKQCLLLDSWSQPLAKGRLESPLYAEKLQVQVLDNQMDAVVVHEIIQLVSIDGDDRPLKCRLVQTRNDRIVLEVLEVLEPEVRNNLRIPVRFESLIYPIGGKWRGRRLIQSVDLSCGGIAFYSDPGLEMDETLEVVIPITEQPLIVRCKILRIRELKNDRTLYAAKFVDLCHDEEKIIRRTVFGVQIRNDHERKKG